MGDAASPVLLEYVPSYTLGLVTRYVLTNAWHTVGINNARATLDLGAAWVFFCGLLAALWKAPSDGSSDATNVVCEVW